MSARTFFFIAVLTPQLYSGVAQAAAAADEHGLRVPSGFRVTLYADSDLANDTYAMTLDAKGCVVVTSKGYIKTLLDTDGDGKADKATLFATTETGGMGLCFDGNDLLFSGDGFLSRYRDADGDGQADGPPEKLLAARTQEHGGHAVRQGPDGWWYFIGGNDAGFNARQIMSPISPVREPMMGALFRLSPDAKQVEVIAHGFRNPYDFDFSAQGDVFTYDSDIERDFLLPWYTPTRLYHVALGGHHGWQLNGYMRGWNRPDYYADTADILSPIGRGSPTGVVCYRHSQFPSTYRGGVFICDWTFGKIYFCPLRPDDATYQTEPEVFLEPTGTHGFAPTDACVAPDGSLFVSIGGRKTRGAVYRITYVGEETESQRLPDLAPPRLEATLAAVLDAPQPLDAWSRARWMPVARKLGAEPFKRVVVDEGRSAAQRARAVEIMTEMFGGLETARALVAAQSKLSQVRARVAWSIGRVPSDNVSLVLLPLAEDPHLAVRRVALEALIQQGHLIEPDALLPVLEPSFAHRDKRIRQAAATIAARLPDAEWRTLWKRLDKAGVQAQLTGALALLWREAAPTAAESVMTRVLPILETVRNEALLLQALRLCMITLGDYNLHKPSVEVFTAYELARPLTIDSVIAERMRAAIRDFFPTQDRQVNVEAARLLAMLGDNDASMTARIAKVFSENSSPILDFHFLTVLARLDGKWNDDLPDKVAHAILSLDRKLAGQEQRTKQSWMARFIEVVTNLAQRETRLAGALLKHPAFVSPNHVELARAFPIDYRLPAAQLFKAVVETNKEFVWTGGLVDLLSSLPPEEVRPLFRAQWSNLSLRDAIAAQLAKHPEDADRERFLDVLASAQTETVRAALTALGQLTLAPDAKHAIPLLKLLQRSLAESPSSVRQQVLALLEKLGGEDAPFKITETAVNVAELRRQYAPVFDSFAKRFPEVADLLASQGNDSAPKWNKLLQAVDWSKGDSIRGAAVFQQRACASCHASANSLGPDLSGAANRFSTEDLFAAIISPNRDVSPAYRATSFRMRDGQVHSGMVAFESADGVIVQTGATATLRLPDNDIISRQPSDLSLMPSGLLDGLEAQELADLYAFLRNLGNSKAQAR